MTAVSVDLGTGTTIGTTANEGVEPHVNWTQQTGFPNFTATNLEDDTTTATTVDLQLSNAKANNSTRASGSGDLFNMFTRGVNVDGPSASTDLIWGQITDEYTTYNLYVYFCELTTSTGGNISFTDGTTTYYYENQAADNFNSGTLTRVTSTSSGTPSTTGNYVLFEGLTAAAPTIEVMSDTDAVQIGLVGCQVVESTAGSSVAPLAFHHLQKLRY